MPIHSTYSFADLSSSSPNGSLPWLATVTIDTTGIPKGSTYIAALSQAIRENWERGDAVLPDPAGEEP